MAMSKQENAGALEKKTLTLDEKITFLEYRISSNKLRASNKRRTFGYPH